MKHSIRLRLDNLESRLTPGRYQPYTTVDALRPSDTAGGFAALRSDSTYSPTNITARSVSHDGRFIAFSSTAPNLVAGQADTNNSADVFLYDNLTGLCRLVSHTSAGPHSAGSFGSQNPALSADGRFVAFESTATDLVSGYVAPPSVLPTQPVQQIYLFDALTGLVTLVTHSATSPLIGGNSASEGPLISADGSAIAFNSVATDLITGFVNASTGGGPGYDAFCYDVPTATLKLASHNHASPLTTVKGGDSYVIGLADDGRTLYFFSGAPDATPHLNSFHTLFAYDVATGTNSPVAAAASPSQSFLDYSSTARQVSGSGNRIAFRSGSILIAPGFIEGVPGDSFSGDIYLRDTAGAPPTLLSHAWYDPARGGNGDSNDALISRNGSVIVFASLATDLLPSFVDQNGVTGRDLFAYDVASQSLQLVTRDVAAPDAGADGSIAFPLSISDDGRFVTYMSNASDLVANFQDRNRFDNYDLFVFDRVTGTTKLVSHLPNSPVSSLDGGTFAATLSGDGSVIYFVSEGSDGDLSAFDANSLADIYRYDMATGQLTAITRRHGPVSLLAGVEGYLSPTGVTDDTARYYAINSYSPNVAPGQIDPKRGQDVFLMDRFTGASALVSHSIAGANVAANDHSIAEFVAPDGSYVLFRSHATDLVPGYTPPSFDSYDLYMFDCGTGQIKLISHLPNDPMAGAGFVPNVLGGSNVSSSADGRYFVYDTGYYQNIVSVQGYVYDRATGESRLVSHIPGSPQTPGNGRNTKMAISRDGQRIYFTNHSTNLIANGQTGRSQIYEFDMSTGEVTLVTHQYGSPLVAANSNSFLDSISDDGNWITINSGANDLIAGAGDTNKVSDIYAYYRPTDTFALVSHAYSDMTQAAKGGSTASTISGDGQYVVFASNASNIVANFVSSGPTHPAVYLTDLATGQTTLVSHVQGLPSTAGGQSMNARAISGDGRYVLFYSSGLLPASPTLTLEGDGGLYLYDRLTQSSRVYSTKAGSATESSNRSFLSPTITRDGRIITFISAADDLVLDDNNGTFDVFYSIQTAPTVKDVVVGDGSQQRSQVRSLTVTFDQPVLFTGNVAAAFTLTRKDLPSQPLILAASVATGNTTVVTLTWSGPLTQGGSLVDGEFTLSIDAAQVLGFGALDGNGDGMAGDHYVTAPGRIFRLLGDGNGDRYVDNFDFVALRRALWSTSSSPNWNLAFDLTGDGNVDMADFTTFRQRIGQSI